MSASTEKKNRQAAREAGTDKKTIAAKEAEKKAAKSKRQWTVGTICVVLLIALILFLSSGFFYSHTTAVTINGVNYSPAQVNYRYAEQYYTWVNQYGNYASIFGLDTSVGPFKLDGQEYTMDDESGNEFATWRDYFLNAAYNGGMSLGLTQLQGLTDYAKANGITLDADELSEIDDQLEQLKTTATLYGYSSINHYLEANYGTGVNQKIARQSAIDSELASKAYAAYSDSLSYSDEELDEYYASLNGDSDSFDYLVYTVYAETVANESGEETVNETTMIEAKTSAEAIEMAFKDGGDIESLYERFNAAIEAEVEGAVCSERDGVTGSSVAEEYRDWIKGERKSGDSTVVENASGNGYLVVVFDNRETNDYPLVSVRHILIEATASEDGSFSDEALAEAKAEAERILAEWKAGEATEDSFAALANQYSSDAGSNTNGGLYENISKGQMVEEFDAFCFGGHKSGDTAIVYGTNGNYAGYHVIYFVGEGELYSRFLARNALSSEALSDWLASVTYEASPKFFERLAGK